ncbi:hypothetical protein HHK36_010449 [Tetracentron sinense]|uniref:Uncharacterized protein n=1 Tax=Tetracentron sinense TaxID=13715 RepID=A0A835DME0_TETSI|nr:hypothetical protein HHK36_010449 [Tetracentron sinense]
MEARPRSFSSYVSLLLLSVSQVMFLMALVKADISDTPTIRRELKGDWPLYDCEECIDKKAWDYRMYTSAGRIDNHPGEELFISMQDMDIVATYSDASGAVQISTVKSKDLSASWVWENPIDRNRDQPKSAQVLPPFQD